MAQMTVKVVATELEKVKQVFQVIYDLTIDERVSSAVREEVKNKVKAILESKDEE